MMEYLIFGMGGVGASVFERLAQNGRAVTGIAHGAHLEAIRERGLIVDSIFGDATDIREATVMAPEEYEGAPDVIFVCVKGYSLDSVYPFLERVCNEDTVVIPLLNLYGTGERMAQRLATTMAEDAPLCTCGCIYVSAELSGPGTLLEHGPICRIFFGMPDASHADILRAVAADATAGRLECIRSDDIRSDTLAKFTYVSPMGATAIICASNAGDAQHEGIARETFACGIGEVVRIGKAMGIDFSEDMVEKNLAILDTLDPIATTSMQRDLEVGRPSEYDGLIEEVIRMGERHGIETPTYLHARRAAHERYGL